VTTLNLLLAVLLLAGNAFFVGAEFAVLSVRRSQVEPLADDSRRARVVLDALKHLSLMLAAAQLGITLCSLGLGAVAEPAVAHLLEDALHAARVPENGDYETVAGYVIAELGRLPAAGDEVEVEGGTLSVQRLDGRRIDRLRFTPAPVPHHADYVTEERR